MQKHEKGVCTWNRQWPRISGVGGAANGNQRGGWGGIRKGLVCYLWILPEPVRNHKRIFSWTSSRECKVHEHGDNVCLVDS